MAERVGFEPTDEDRSSPVFKTGAFNHSATFPLRIAIIRTFLKLANFKTLNREGAWKLLDKAARFACSPSWSGWTHGLMYSNGLRDDTSKWSKNQHYYGAGLKYERGPWKSSVILEMETKDKEADPQTKPKYTINYGVEYNTGSWTPMFTYRCISQDGNVKRQKFGLSAIIPYFSGFFKAAAYQFGSDEQINGRSDKVTHCAYEYPLSNRTVIQPFICYAGSEKGWKDYVNDLNIYNAWEAYIGMHHFF